MIRIMIAIFIAIGSNAYAQDFLGGMAPKSADKQKADKQKSKRKVNLPDKPNYKDAKGLRQGEWGTKYPNGRYRYEATFKDDKPVGKVKRYDEDGRLVAVLTYQANGIVTSITYHENGKMESKGKYKNQKKEGTWTFYDHNERLIMEVPYSDGKEHGIAKLLYENGKTLEMTTWVDGMKEGPYTKYFVSGQKEVEATYSKNELNGPYRVWGSDGKIVNDGQFAYGVKVGRWKVRFPQEGNYEVTILYDKHGLVINRAEVDSVENLRIKYIEKQLGKHRDPEEYVSHPEDYVPF